MQAELSRLRVVASDVAPAVDPDEPVREDVPTPGAYIREQRQRRGMSIEQLAVATKIPASSLRLLEDDAFEGLPGPVFVKGFLRCCTRALGLSSETVMELLYERERAALQARRQQQRPSQADMEIPSVTAPEPTLPPRLKQRPAPDGGVVRNALLGLSRANMLQWLFIAALVAVLVMAALVVAGDSLTGSHT